MPRLNNLLNKAFLARRRNKITIQNLKVHYDPGSPLSYPGSGLTLYDISGNNRHATLANTMEHNSFRGFFQWSSNYIDFPNSSNAEIAAGFSYFIWYYPLQDGISNQFFKNSPYTLTTQYKTDGTFYIAASLSVLSGTAKKDITCSVTIGLPKSAWLHIGVVYNNVDLMIYIDKVLVTFTPKTYNPGNATVSGSSVRWGRTTWFNQIYYITGKTGIFRFYSYGAPSTAVTAIYNEDKSRYFGSGLPGNLSTNGLIFNTRGQLTNDTAGSTTGTVLGTVNYSAALGGYTYFGDYPSPLPNTFTNLVRYANTATLQNLTSISICAWVNFPNSTNSVIVEKKIAGLSSMRPPSILSTGFLLARSSTTGITFSYGNSTTVNPTIRTKSPIFANRWYHVAVTLGSGVGAKIYVNGEEEADAFYSAGSAASAISLGNTVPMNIGRAKNQSVPFSGGGPGRDVNIASLQIYNRIITDNEIWENFTAERANFGI